MSHPAGPLPWFLQPRFAPRHGALIARATFPLHGYDELLDELVALCASHKPQRVLELQAREGNLTAQLVAAGHHVTALEADLAQQARLCERLPEITALAHIQQCMGERFHRVVHALAWHTLPEAQRMERIEQLCDELLLHKGALVFGDVSVEDEGALKALPESFFASHAREHVIVASTLKAALIERGFKVTTKQVAAGFGIFRVSTRKS